MLPENFTTSTSCPPKQKRLYIQTHTSLSPARLQQPFDPGNFAYKEYSWNSQGKSSSTTSHQQSPVYRAFFTISQEHLDTSTLSFS